MKQGTYNQGVLLAIIHQTWTRIHIVEGFAGVVMERS